MRGNGSVNGWKARSYRGSTTCGGERKNKKKNFHTGGRELYQVGRQKGGRLQLEVFIQRDLALDIEVGMVPWGGEELGLGGGIRKKGNALDWDKTKSGGDRYHE